MTLAAQIAAAFQRVGALIGIEKDWASQLNSALTPVQNAGAATEAQTGVTQFANMAETLAGLLGTKAVSPLRLIPAANTYTNRKDISSGTYTLVLADLGAALENTSSATTTVTIPPNSAVPFPVGARIYLYQGPNSGGVVTAVPGTGVSIRVRSGFSTPSTNNPWSRIALRQRATDDWVAEEFDLAMQAQIADLLPGGRLAPTAKDVSNGDWNLQLTSGHFMGSPMANAPGGNTGWNWVIVQRYADTWVSQIAHTFTLNNGTAVAGTMYQRTLLNGTWGPWRRIISEEALPVIDRGGLNQSTSWNSILTPGVYLFNGGGGTPSGYPGGVYNYGVLLVLTSGTGCMQMYFPDGANTPVYRVGFSAVPNGFGSGNNWSKFTTTTIAAQQ